MTVTGSLCRHKNDNMWARSFQHPLEDYDETIKHGQEIGEKRARWKEISTVLTWWPGSLCLHRLFSWCLSFNPPFQDSLLQPHWPDPWLRVLLACAELTVKSPFAVVQAEGSFPSSELSLNVFSMMVSVCMSPFSTARLLQIQCLAALHTALISCSLSFTV